MFTTHDKVVTGGTATTQARLQGVSHSGGMLNAVEITWLRNDQASATNGLRVYALDDADVFREVDVKNYLNAPTIGSAATFTVTSLSAGQEYHALLDVSRYRGVAVEYTAGATGPTNWNGCIVAHISVAALQR
jgi:hypothetical protein